MAKENPIVVENREELFFLLSEAAQLEHMIMCQYLFATFSLKRDTSEGLTQAQLEAIKRWERIVLDVAVQEMLHLALVNNLLIALGSIPYFDRPNFPLQVKYFPAGIRLMLLPFGEQALQHFLFLERPEGMTREDAIGFEAARLPNLPMPLDDIAPEAQDYATVGHLYRGIEQGFRHLVDKYGEERVFIGPPQAQMTQKYFGWPELIPVTDLASAVQAIETIVEQGEGARGEWQHAHYGKFLEIWNEYHAMKGQDPSFEPARPVTAAFTRSPLDTADVELITDPFTADVANLFNVSYEVVLQVLIRLFIYHGETEEELKTLSGVAIDAMFSLIEPLGQLLTTLPFGPNAPGRMAGASFEIYRTGYMLPHRYAAWMVLYERFLEVTNYCAKLNQHPSAPKQLMEIEQNMRTFVATLEQHIKGLSQDTY
jgi:Ferritin-like